MNAILRDLGLKRRGEYMEYPALFSPDPEKGGFVVTFPDFGWGVTQGESEQEAMEMATDLLHILIADRIGKQETLPRVQKRRGARYRLVRLAALEAAKGSAFTANGSGPAFARQSLPGALGSRNRISIACSI
jgi:predicted RNase H-like HicB family nuclease